MGEEGEEEEGELWTHRSIVIGGGGNGEGREGEEVEGGILAMEER